MSNKVPARTAIRRWTTLAIATASLVGAGVTGTLATTAATSTTTAASSQSTTTTANDSSSSSTTGSTSSNDSFSQVNSVSGSTQSAQTSTSGS
ncbi:MAG: hypothetical protein ACK5MT_01065 [Actinomycetales bacterium]